jgi:hypothetical protein
MREMRLYTPRLSRCQRRIKGDNENFRLPNLEQDFWAHAKEAVCNTKRENHRHAIDVPRGILSEPNKCVPGLRLQTEEPRERSN